MAPRTWFPEVLKGAQVVLRRHIPDNLEAFRRWYSDPEIARLARYQEAPMRTEEIERFFTARVVGPDAMAMAIHERATDRLVGTCAFSQLDGDNGSALYHITIGEKDAWGLGYGTEATRLMLDHAFDGLGLHRIALFVFEFNERAIRTYRRCGFIIEGRARESIFRDGRWWDELAMSVLDRDWHRTRATDPDDVDGSASLPPEADPDVGGPAPDGVAPDADGDVAPVGARVASRTRLIEPTVRRFS